MTRLTIRRHGQTSMEEDAKTDAARAPFISRQLENFSVLSNDGLELNERNAESIPKDTGMEIHGDPEILDIFRVAMCDVQGPRVRFEPGFCRRTIQASAPRQFKQHARNKANSMQLGGNAPVLCSSWDPPFVHDLDRGRRYAS